MNTNIFEIVWEWRYRQWNRDQGHRSYSLSFMHLLMRLMILNVDNLLICIYVVYTKYNYLFLNLTNFDFEKKVWQNRGRCTRVGKRVQRRGGAVLPGTPPHVSVGSGPWVGGKPFPQWHFSPSRCLYKTNRAIVFMSIFTQKHHTNNHLVRIWSVWRLI